MASTILDIVGLDLGNYSCRGLQQKLQPIAAASQIRRTVNGDLISLGQPMFRKYKSTISCTDQEAPILTNIWQGSIVTVTCLDQLLGPDPVTLTMMVMDFDVSRDEYGAMTGWSLDLEQV